MKKQLLIFDCDGVLVDSEGIAMSVLIDGVRAAGADIDDQTAYSRFLGSSTKTVLEVLRKEFDVDLTLRQRELMRVRLHERLHGELRPMPGMVAALARITHRLCVASSSQPDRIRLSLSLTGLLDYFEPHIFSAGMVQRGKPAPDLFLHAASTLGVAPADCIVIEDSPLGIRAARSAGMQVLAFTGGSHAALSDLETAVTALEPDACFADMRALPGLIAELDDHTGTRVRRNDDFVQETC